MEGARGTAELEGERLQDLCVSRKGSDRGHHGDMRQDGSLRSDGEMWVLDAARHMQEVVYRVISSHPALVRGATALGSVRRSHTDTEDDISTRISEASRVGAAGRRRLMPCC